MNISKVHIKNFKIFNGSFDLTLNKGVGIVVYNNEQSVIDGIGYF